MVSSGAIGAVRGARLCRMPSCVARRTPALAFFALVIALGAKSTFRHAGLCRIRSCVARQTVALALTALVIALLAEGARSTRLRDGVGPRRAIGAVRGAKAAAEGPRWARRAILNTP